MTVDQNKKRRSQIGRGEAAPAIIEAAGKLFAQKGYASTSIQEIAAAASVARPTIFTAVGSKATIFRAVLESAVGGENPQVPPTEQPWLISAINQSDPQEVLRLYVHNIRLIGERISDLYWAAECAAEFDSDVREVFKVIKRGRLSAGEKVAAALQAQKSLAPGLDNATAAVTLNTIVSPASWRALVVDAGWSPDEFEAWSYKVVTGMLLPRSSSNSPNSRFRPY